MVQHLLAKPLQGKQKYTGNNKVRSYRTNNPPLWPDACSCLDSSGFLKGDLCIPLGVYVASLLHGV